MAAKVRALILGGGPTGILTAWSLKEKGITDLCVVEKTGAFGDIAQCHRFGEWCLDFAPHALWTDDERVLTLIQRALDTELRTAADERVGMWLHGAPMDCPLSFLRLMRALPTREVLQTAASAARWRFLSRGSVPSQTYEGRMIARYGKRLYQNTLAPMARKMWAVEPPALSEDLAAEDVISGPPYGQELPQQSRYFPKSCLGEMWHGAVRRLQEAGVRVLTSAALSSIRAELGRIVSVSVSTGTEELEFAPDFVVSTVPLHELVPALGSQLSREVHIALERLLYRALIVLYVVLHKPRMSPFHSIYFPQPEYVFQRLFQQKNFAELPGSDEITVVGAEISCFEKDSTWRASDKELFNQVVAGLERSQLATASEIGEFKVAREPHAYPMYIWNYRGALQTVLDQLCRIENLLPNGRHGLFRLSGIDHCAEMALAAAEHVSGEAPPQNWRATIRNRARTG